MLTDAAAATLLTLSQASHSLVLADAAANAGFALSPLPLVQADVCTPAVFTLIPLLLTPLLLFLFRFEKVY